MTSLPRNLVLLLLFLTASPLLTHTASTSRPTHPPIRFMPDTNTNDYGEVEDEIHNEPPIVKVSARTTLSREMQFCRYDPCSEEYESCTDLSKKTRCLCPGVSGDNLPPLAPRIHMLLPVSQGEHKGKVEVQWCAPSSVVSKYRVLIEGSEGDTVEFQAGSRKGLVRSLEVGTKVCVEAVNKVGQSSPSDFSCQRYTPPSSSDHKLLAGVIGGGVALLLILIIGGVILWKYQLCRKAKSNSADGLGNPSYSTEGTL